jgi:catechol 2,3-dioxygenase-like lactoylglutathione lyase family enzyme
MGPVLLDVAVIQNPQAAAVALEPIRSRLLAELAAPASAATLADRLGIKFYTDVLGFRKKLEIPVGEYRWITVVSPDGPADIELALEPVGYPFAEDFQKALHSRGIPLTAFAVDDIEKEYNRLTRLGVSFQSPPKPMGPTKMAVFDDTCGNFIQIYQG